MESRDGHISEESTVGSLDGESAYDVEDGSGTIVATSSYTHETIGGYFIPYHFFVDIQKD